MFLHASDLTLLFGEETASSRSVTSVSGMTSRRRSDERRCHARGGRQVFGFARMMTWLSLTTTEKSTPFAWYCSMIFGA